MSRDEYRRIMTQEAEVPLELDDIQSGVLRPRPAPYTATYVLLRIDDRRAGRELMRRASTVVASAAHPTGPAADAWVSASLSFRGLKALGVPQDLLDSFPWEFQQGNGRAGQRPRRHRREQPWKLGKRPRGVRRAHRSYRHRSGSVAARIRVRACPQDMTRTARHHGDLALGLLRAPHRAGALRVQRRHQPPCGRRRRYSWHEPGGAPLKAGEFVVRRDGGFPPMPRPEVLGRNGTYIVFRKLHQRVAAFRQYLKRTPPASWKRSF